jgi:hypothetical protein
MSIKDFELFHGIVLTKMIRSDHPVSLTMIETNRDQFWSAYRVNDASFLYIKYRTGARKTRRPRGLSWVFTFGDDQLQQIRRLKEQHPVFLALVCIAKKPLSVCLLEPSEIERCINLDGQRAQSIIILYQQNRKLRVHGPLNSEADELRIPQSRIDRWTPPGN